MSKRRRGDHPTFEFRGRNQRPVRRRGDSDVATLGNESLSSRGYFCLLSRALQQNGIVWRCAVDEAGACVKGIVAENNPNVPGRGRSYVIFNEPGAGR